MVEKGKCFWVLFDHRTHIEGNLEFFYSDQPSLMGHNVQFTNMSTYDGS